MFRYRRGSDDLLILLIGACIGAAVQLWLEPHERALGISDENQHEHLMIVGRVHFAQLVGTLMIVGLHWIRFCKFLRCRSDGV